MASEEQLAILKQGVGVWNRWRIENPDVETDFSGANLEKVCLVEESVLRIDLRGANLSGANLGGADLGLADLNMANLSGAILGGANLSGATLRGADLSGARLNMACLLGADLNGADLNGANLGGADLFRADLSNANLSGAHLGAADLSRANLHMANLSMACLVESCFVNTNLEGANLEGARVYGTAAWDLNLKGTNQRNLIITPLGEPTITVDNLEVAQFIYLLLNNQNLRKMIDTVTSKAVLILGNFNDRCKPVLDALRQNLRERGFVPIMFDFPTPDNRDMTETVNILAQMSKFVIADVSEQRSVPHELESVIPDLAVPVQIIAREDQRPYAMLTDLMKYPWVMKPLKYGNQEALESDLDDIVRDTIAKADEIKENRLRIISDGWGLR